MMTIAEILDRMIAYPGNTVHDIEHLLKVWGYARTIGQLEGLDEHTQRLTEIAAIVHDIACPSLRARYGCCNGKRQEQEGVPMAEAFLRECGLPEADVQRVAFLVGHHHTFTGVDGIDWQILLEADYLVNGSESGFSMANLRNFAERICRTRAGRALFKSVYHV